MSQEIMGCQEGGTGRQSPKSFGEDDQDENKLDLTTIPFLKGRGWQPGGNGERVPIGCVHIPSPPGLEAGAVPATHPAPSQQPDEVG